MCPTDDNTVVTITQEVSMCGCGATWLNPVFLIQRKAKVTVYRDARVPTGGRRGLRSYGRLTGRRDFRMTKARAPAIRADSIQYLGWLVLNTKGVATMAMAQTSDQTILEVGVTADTVAPGRPPAR